MSVGLYMDVHVPAAITRALALRGVDVITAQLDGSTLFSDAQLLNRATQLERVLFSQDRDLLAEACLRQREARFFAGIIYAHQLGITIGRCIGDLELLAQCGEPQDFASQIEYLPL